MGAGERKFSWHNSPHHRKPLTSAFLALGVVLLLLGLASIGATTLLELNSLRVFGPMVLASVPERRDKQQARHRPWHRLSGPAAARSWSRTVKGTVSRTVKDSQGDSFPK